MASGKIDVKPFDQPDTVQRETKKKDNPLEKRLRKRFSNALFYAAALSWRASFS
jgi:hypothetical protein